MSRLNQLKIDLAVLHKLFEMLDMDYGSGAPVEIIGLFEAIVPELSEGRVKLALTELEKSQDAMIDPEQPHSWQITREGSRRVERSLAIPTTFLARLHTNGDIWLNSQEAHEAVIRQRIVNPHEPAPSVVLLQEEMASEKPATFNWTKWGTMLTGLSIVVALFIWKYS